MHQTVVQYLDHALFTCTVSVQIKKWSVQITSLYLYVEEECLDVTLSRKKSWYLLLVIMPVHARVF
jgi:hypothetical protein